MDAAIGGAVEQKQMIGDLAYGRTGWLKDVAREIDRYRHPTKPCSWIRDVRPRASRIHQPHRAYRIPLDLRAFTVPQGLLDQIKREDDAEGKQRIRRRMIRERKLAREINAMAAAVNQGNTMVAQSGLLGDAYAYEPSVLHKDHYVEGTTIGNQAWIPPKIKNRQDPPVVQHKRTSIGFEFLRINTRKPPHWLGARIANGYKTVAKRLHTHEFYYYITEDLKLEEEFEHRLGIDDKGYWVYTWNYREYLRYKIKTFTYAPGEDIQDSELLREMREGSEEHERMDAFVTESEVGR
ncbi:hypothetical protein EV175_004741 [Coemansia sp. RSA 1933]|nr:hypothetical protein EV175_004741 [Coemansia sp. RSA 1933]